MDVILGDNLPAPLRAMLGEGFEILPWETAATSELAERERITGLVAYGHPVVDGDLMDRLPNLRVISNHGVGVDHIVVPDAVDRGIPVGNTPGCLDASTADLTLALLLATARNVVRGDRFARGPEFTVFDPSILIGREVTGARLGIVGMGRIGKEVAKRARAFDMDIVYHNRRRDEAAEAELGVRYVSFEELLEWSEYVVLNCPLTDETTGLIGAAELARMRDDAILVNTARGGVVDTTALTQALAEGRIAGAGLDVTEPEPLPRDHPLLSMENVVITPHLGSASDRTRHRMMQMTVENLEAGLRGDPLPYAVGL